LTARQAWMAKHLQAGALATDGEIMSNLVEYEEYTPEDAEADEKELSKGSGAMMTLQVGSNKIRVVPKRKGQPKLMTVAWQHYIDVPGVESAIRFNCPRNMLKRPCLACDAADKLMSTGNPADRARAEEMNPRKRVFICVIDRANPEDGPKILAIPKQVADALTALRDDEDVGGDFTHPEDGYDVIITKPKSFKGGKKYTVMPARQSSPLGPDVETMNLWIEEQPSASRYASVETTEQIREKCEDLMHLLQPSAPAPRASSNRQIAGRRPAQAKPQKPRTAADDAMDAPAEDAVEGEYQPPDDE